MNDQTDQRHGAQKRQEHNEGSSCQPEKWIGLIARLPQPRLPPHDSARTAAIIGREERVELSAELLLRRWLIEKRDVSANDLWQSVPRFREAYRSANALGTFLSRGVAGHGLDLRVKRGTAYRRCYENAWSLLKKLTAVQLSRVAHRLGYSNPDDLRERLLELPRQKENDGEKQQSEQEKPK